MRFKVNTPLYKTIGNITDVNKCICKSVNLTEMKVVGCGWRRVGYGKQLYHLMDCKINEKPHRLMFGRNDVMEWDVWFDKSTQPTQYTKNEMLKVLKMMVV